MCLNAELPGVAQRELFDSLLWGMSPDLPDLWPWMADSRKPPTTCELLDYLIFGEQR